MYYHAYASDNRTNIGATAKFNCSFLAIFSSASAKSFQLARSPSAKLYEWYVYQPSHFVAPAVKVLVHNMLTPVI